MVDVGHSTTHRRGFLGRVAASAAAFGLGGLVAPFTAAAEPPTTAGNTSARHAMTPSSRHCCNRTISPCSTPTVTAS